MRPLYVSAEELKLSDGPYSKPLMDECSFMKGWGIITILISIYTLLLHSEEDDRVKPNEENLLSLKESFKVAFNLIWNKNLFLYFFFTVCWKAFTSFSNVSSIYLLDEQKYDQMKYSIMNGLIFPIGIYVNIYFSKIVYQNPFRMSYKTQFTRLIVDIIFVNIFLANYTALNNFSETIFDVLLFIMLLAKTSIDTISFACQIAVMNKM